MGESGGLTAGAGVGGDEIQPFPGLRQGRFKVTANPAALQPARSAWATASPTALVEASPPRSGV